jgi:TonB family protein
MEGSTAATGGTGVAVPRGDSQRVDPAVKRVGKGPARPKSSGFKKRYGAGEAAPLAVVTTMPKVLSRAVPEYPQRVRDLGIEGQVVASLQIDGKGRVTAVKILRGLHPVLDAAAMSAARRTRFAPAEVDGVPVAVTISFTFTFVLD